ncbi:MAG: LuxR C-terminal-related transcriptional regulator [Roseiflexaceae bacterium]|nr:LuxR C-terminal-related transcriptional regulator [Roseiflexaceae bacterium]
MSESLLIAKITLPARHHGFIPRQRLATQLRHLIDVPVTLISAPVGFGKTTAMQEALRSLREQRGTAFAWLTLDAHDNDPVHFWRYIALALHTAIPECGAAMIEALAGPQPAPVRPLLAATLDEIAATGQRLVLVLDDYHCVDLPDIHNDLTFLADHAPSNLHIVLIAHADPPLPLHRWRAQGKVFDVCAADLRFDRTEAATLLNDIMHLRLSEDDITTLLNWTEGWPAALHLAGLVLRQDTVSLPTRHDRIARLAQSNRFIIERLTEEALAQQPVEVRTRLLRISILDRLCGSLCDAVAETTGSAALLEMLAQDHLFILPLGLSAPHGESWFRFHPLFGNLLREQARRSFPEGIATLYRRAAFWHAAHGDVEQAIEYAFAGRDFACAAQLLERSASTLVMEGRASLLERWLGLLPGEWRQTLPRASVAFAWTLILGGRCREAAPYLEQAAATLPLDNPLLQGELCAARAVLAETRERSAEALEYAQQALDLAPADHLIVQAAARSALAGALRAAGDVDAAIAAYEQAVPLCQAARLPLLALLGRAHLGSLYLMQGRLCRAEAVLQPALRLAAFIPVASLVFVVYSAILFERNQLEDAHHYLMYALNLAQQSGHAAVLAQCYIHLARLQRAWGDQAGAQIALDAAAAYVAQGIPAWIEPLLIAEQVYLHLDQGAVTKARRTLAGRGAAVETTTGAMREALPLAHARLLLHQGRNADARALLDDIVASARQSGRQGWVIEALLLRALACDALNDEAAALDDLRCALEMAEPEGYVRVFLNAGVRLARLLCRIGSAYAHRLLEAFPSSVRDCAADLLALSEPLTIREREVLRLMARGLTYQQIASELIISVNTVRYHIKSLYSKLRVTSRSLALARARALRLLEET